MIEHCRVSIIGTLNLGIDIYLGTCQVLSGLADATKNLRYILLVTIIEVAIQLYTVSRVYIQVTYSSTE